MIMMFQVTSKGNKWRISIDDFMLALDDWLSLTNNMTESRVAAFHNTIRFALNDTEGLSANSGGSGPFQLRKHEQTQGDSVDLDRLGRLEVPQRVLRVTAGRR